MTALKLVDQELPDRDNDATLAEQFVPGRRTIFASVEGTGASGEPGPDLPRRIWMLHAVRNGAAKAAAEANAGTFKKVAVVSAERREDVLRSAGFERLTPIFRGLPSWAGLLSHDASAPVREHPMQMESN